MSTDFEPREILPRGREPKARRHGEKRFVAIPRPTGMAFDQREFDLRCEWGLYGVAHLAPSSDVVVVVDVLTLSTAGVVAAARGATVLPYRWQEDSATDYARSVHALLAEPRGKATYSLSPRSLMALPAGSRIVLPSPNGATLSLTTGATPTFTGCLRNARSVAAAARACGPCVAVIACHAPILQRRSLIGDSVRGHSRNHCLGDGMVHQVLQALVRPRIDSGDRRRRRLGRQPGERRILAQSSLARVPIRAAYSFAEPDRAVIFPIRRPLALCIRKDITNQWIGNALCALRVSGYISGKNSRSAMPNNQDKAVKRYRKRLKRERWVRCEVNVRREDAPLVRKVATVLNDLERDTVARALIRERFEKPPVSSLKCLLAAAPREGIDIERPRDPGREIDLRCS